MNIYLISNEFDGVYMSKYFYEIKLDVAGLHYYLIGLLLFQE